MAEEKVVEYLQDRLQKKNLARPNQESLLLLEVEKRSKLREDQRGRRRAVSSNRHSWV